MDTTGLGAYLQDLAGDNRFSGALSITREGQELWSSAHGPASRTWGVPNSVDIRFDTASITKVFTSILALQCVDEELLGLDTTAVACLGLERTSIHPDVTLRQLLTHTSGVGDDAEEENGEDYAEIWKTRISYAVRNTIDLFAQFVHKKANFPPGQGCRYCNVGFVLAGAMVETVRGATYRDLVRSRVFEVAGMSDSGFFSMDLVEPGVAEGADLIEGSWVRNIYSYPPVGSPDGGAHCTVADLQRFVLAVQGATLLAPETTELFMSPQHFHSENESGSRYMGFGLEFQLDRSGNVLFWEKEGMNAGASGFLRHYPDSGTTVAMLSNMAAGVWEPRKRIHEMINP